MQCPQVWWLWPLEPSCGSLRIPWNSLPTAPGKVAALALGWVQAGAPLPCGCCSRGGHFPCTEELSGPTSSSRPHFRAHNPEQPPRSSSGAPGAGSALQPSCIQPPWGANPGAELWGVPKPNQRIPHTGNVPISRLASCTAACGPWLSPHPPHATLPVLALPQRSPPELPPRESPLDVGAKAINCTQPSLELEIHQLAFNS